MALDRRTTHNLVQALLHARNKKDGSDVLQNVPHARMASSLGSYGEPIFRGTRSSFASQPGVTTGDNVASQPHNLLLTPRPQPFRDPAGFVYPGKVEKRPNGERAVSKAFHPNIYPTTDVSRVHPVTPATQIGFGGAGTYQGSRGTEQEFNAPRVHSDSSPRSSHAHNEAAKATVPEHLPTALRLADGESYLAREATQREKKLPKVRYPTSGEIWSEFLGGIGKGVVQTLSDIAAEDARQRQAMVDGIYIDSPNPDWFGPPKSPWENTGRETAPGVMVTTRPVKRKPKTWYDKKIGKVEPPKHLKPGTVLFGDAIHPEVARFVVDSFPEAKFDVRVKPGQKGVDLTRIEGSDWVDKYFEIKPNNPHSQRALKRQIQKWGYDEPSVRVMSYDEYGNIYDGFGR